MSFCIEDLETSLCEKELSQNLSLSAGQSIAMEELMKSLQRLGFEYHEYEKKGSYIRKGDIIKIVLPQNGTVSLNFWGDTIDEIFTES